MTYATVAAMTQSASLIDRMTASAASEHKEKPYQTWVANHIWDLVSSPGWSEAWESAAASGVTDPGARGDVITDGMILGAVQPMDDLAIEPEGQG